jgi:hypothetical protein
MGDEARLAAAGWPFQQDGEAASKRCLEQSTFVALRLIDKEARLSFRFPAQQLQGS